MKTLDSPWGEAEKATGTEPSTLSQFIMDLARSLKVPFGVAVLGMTGFASFKGDRTATAQNC